MSAASVAHRIPRPVDLVRVDYAAKLIQFPVVVFGSIAARAIEDVWNATRAPDSQFVSVSQPGEPVMNYLPMWLGDIRGFKTRIHLYGFGLDTRLTAALALHSAPAASAILAFAPGTHATTEAGVLLQLLATALSKTVPVAAIGDADLVTEWQTITGRAPIHTPSGPFDALKAVAKIMLGQLRAQAT